jgi:S-adenosylmethionine uptake transporter
MSAALNPARLGILFMLVSMFCISLNDMLIKSLSGDYPLHQLVFVRSTLGLIVSLVFLKLEGGFSLLRTAQPKLHVLRAMLVVFANSMFYAAIVMMPLATATAIYFVAPLIVTLLSIPVLNERVGPRRLGAVLIGFIGVVVMQWPQISGSAEGIGWVALLPMLAATGYASASVLTRKLGTYTKASAFAVYMQVAFVIVGTLFFVLAGKGQYFDPSAPESLQFLFRPWITPQPADYLPLLGLGAMAAVVGYTISQAYRMTAASVVAPFEYILLIYALFWGWTIFGEWPAPTVFAGAAIIISAGFYIVWRERTVKS